jgi:cytosine/adenosine deaminase-related metal-dependent hydrolase
MNDCGAGSPVAHLARHGVLSKNFLAVHANYLARDDAALLARSGASVVHCPRSHAFFEHRAFPADELERAGVNVCLGTDSLATVLRSRAEPLALSLFSEMRAFAGNFPERSPQSILEMATACAAEAIGCGETLGALAPGLFADLIAVPAERGRNVYERLLNYRGDVAGSMIRGTWAMAPAA